VLARAIGPTIAAMDSGDGERLKRACAHACRLTAVGPHHLRARANAIKGLVRSDCATENLTAIADSGNFRSISPPI